ncbi:hypothetical protein H4R33_005614 [Dimargaris cristalligena]|nr:hypothetical protein H4R33_005614 [Dimargaris cristalligena]
MIHFILRLTAAALLAASHPAFYTVAAGNDTSASAIPPIDTSATGQLAITGQFSGISRLSSVSSTTNQPLLSSQASSAIFVNGTSLDILGSASKGDQIMATCQIHNAKQSLVFIGGNFTTFAGVASQSIIAYDLTRKQAVALGRGLDGSVLSLYCDNARELVYVGGFFTGPLRKSTDTNSPPTRGFGPNSIIWGSGTWLPAPFKGLDGYVNTIAASPSGKTIYFGGNFTQTADDESSLPLGSQPVNLGAATVTSGNDNSSANYSSPLNAICTVNANRARNPWLLRDLMPGFWRVDFTRSIRPALLRIKNTNWNGRGTQTFRLESAPQYVAIALSYIDPNTNKRIKCTESCPLALDSSNWQEFVVDDDVNTTGVRINIEAWYGQGAGLQAVEIYQRDITASPIDRVNNACNSVNYDSTTHLTGGWTQVTVPLTQHTYLQAAISTAKLDTTTNTVEYSPDVTESGYYKVSLRIPGCQYNNDCATRTSVDLSMALYPGQSDKSTIGQDSLTDTDVLFYTGFVAARNDTFMPTVKLTLSSKPVFQSGTSSVNLVVSALIITKVPSMEDLGGIISLTPQGNTYETLQWESLAYDSLQTPLSEGAVVRSLLPYDDNNLLIGGYFADKTSGAFNLVKHENGKLVSPGGAGLNDEVTQMVLVGSNDVYIGGRFTGTHSQSTDNKLNRIAVMSLRDNKFSAVGGGLNGAVEYVTLAYHNQAPIVYLGGAFTTAYKDGNHTQTDLKVRGLAAWDIKDQSWTGTPFLNGGIQSMNGQQVFTDSELSQLSQSNNSATPLIFAGPFTAAASSRVPGIIGMSGTYDLSPVISDSLLSSDTTGGTVSSFSRNGAAVHTGIYFSPSSNEDGQAPELVIAGRFRGPTDDIRNIALVSSDSLSPLGQGINGEIHSLALADSKLFIGGIPLEGDNQGFNGFTVWNFQTEEYVLSISHLSGQSDGGSGLLTNDYLNNVLQTNSSVFVKQIVSLPNTQTVVVGGRFSRAGSLQCDSVCLFNYQANQWQNLGTGLPGVVTSLSVVGGQKWIMAGGNFTIGQQAHSLALYGTEFGTWIAFPSTSTLPGPILSIAVIDNGKSATDLSSSSSSSSSKSSDTKNTGADTGSSTAQNMVSSLQFYLSGTVGDSTQSYLWYWNGSSFAPLTTAIDLQGSLIQDISLVPLNVTDPAKASKATTTSISSAATSSTQSPSPSPSSAGLQKRDQVPVPSKARRATDDTETAIQYGLMVSGVLSWSQFGQVSTALYNINDKSWFPLLRAINEDGTTGSVGSVFYPLPDNIVQSRHYLSTALVIIISIAISLALVFLIVLVGLAYIYWRNKRRTAAVISATAASASVPAQGDSGTDFDFNNQAAKFEPWNTNDPSMADPTLAAGAVAGLGVRGLNDNDAGAVFMNQPFQPSAEANQPPKSTAATLNSNNNRLSTSPYHHYYSSDPNMTDMEDLQISRGEGIAAGAATAGALGKMSGKSVDKRPLSIGSVLNGFDVDEINDMVDQHNYQNATGPSTSAPGAQIGLAPLPIRNHPNHMVESPPSPHHLSNFDDGELFNQGRGHIEMTSLNDNLYGRSPSPISHDGTGAAAAAAAAMAGLSNSPSKPGNTGGDYTTMLSLESDANSMTADNGRLKGNSYQLDSPTLPLDQQILMSPGIIDGNPVPGLGATFGHSSQNQVGAHIRQVDDIYNQNGWGPAGKGGDGSSPGGKEGQLAGAPMVPDHTENSRKAARDSAETSKLVNAAPERSSTIRDSLKDHPVYYAKFPFNAREHGELEFRAGERIFVIDNSDDIWWMGLIDRGEGQAVLQGVFPASYVSEQPPESSEAWRYI